MGLITEGLIRRLSAAAEEYRLLLLNHFSVRAFNPERTAYFKRSSCYHSKYGLLILHDLRFDP